MKQYLDYWKRGLEFTGETTRYTYWYQQLINGLIALTIMNLTLMGMMFSNNLGTMRIIIWTGFIVLMIFSVLTILPELAVNVRRLRNAGLPWALIFVKIMGSVFDILMLMPAKKPAPRLERKERFYWLGAISIVLSFVGMIVMLVNTNMWIGVGIMAVGYALAIVELVLNLKRRRVMALVSLTVAMSTAMMFFGFNTVKQYKQVYENSSSVQAMDTFVYDALSFELGNTGQPVSELEIVKSDEVLDLDGVHIKVMSTKVINDNYIRVAVEIDNTSKRDFDLFGLAFELAENKDDTRMIEYDPRMSNLDLEDYNFRLIDDQTIEPGETLKGTVTFEAKMSDAGYLVMGDWGQRDVAFELKK